MSIFNALNTSIYSALSGSTALTSLLAGGTAGTAIFYLQAPDSKPLPYVVWSYQGGGPLNLAPSDLRDELLFVRAYAASPGLAGSIDAQLSTLLHRKKLTVTGWTNFWTAREGDLALVENQPNQTQVFMAGAIYRIRLTD